MKRKYYLTLDTETATLPFVKKLCANEKQRKDVAIAKPLVYDIGWVITNRQGEVMKKESFLVQETFFVPAVFNTAYYCDKRPIYMERLKAGETKAKNWNDIAEILLEDLRYVDISAAYNAAFDFKKAIPFTETYIRHLYNSDYNEWERKQYFQCSNIANGNKKTGTRPNFLDPVFQFREEEFPITDLWAIACDRLINIDKYRDYCLQNGLLTASAQYFRSSAETTFQYLMNKHDFEEEHTALSDALIEAMVLAKALKKGKVTPYMESFPFKNLGTTFDYVREKRPKYVNAVLLALDTYLDSFDSPSRYYDRMQNIYYSLQEFADNYRPN